LRLNDVIKFSVMDKNKLMADSFMGKFERTLKDLLNAQGNNESIWMDLEQSRTGKILISVKDSSATPSATPSKSETSSSKSGNSTPTTTKQAPKKEESVDEHLDRFKKEIVSHSPNYLVNIAQSVIEEQINGELTEKILGLEDLSRRYQTESKTKLLEDISKYVSHYFPIYNSLEKQELKLAKHQMLLKRFKIKSRK